MLKTSSIKQKPSTWRTAQRIIYKYRCVSNLSGSLSNTKVSKMSILDNVNNMTKLMLGKKNFLVLKTTIHDISDFWKQLKTDYCTKWLISQFINLCRFDQSMEIRYTLIYLSNVIIYWYAWLSLGYILFSLTKSWICKNNKITTRVWIDRHYNTLYILPMIDRCWW